MGKTVVILSGGYHPYHAGHYALYQSAQRAFPDADVYVAATDDRSTRPFPFVIKEKLAKLAGVEPGHFVQVKSPFQAAEITKNYDPEKDTVIFVRSEKDADQPPRAGGVKKDGSPSYLQPLLGAKKLEPFGRHAYMAYLPVVEFGPGMTSATEIRTAWPSLNPKRKTALVMSLYPATQKNPKLADTVVKMLDTAIGSDLEEGMQRPEPSKILSVRDREGVITLTIQAPDGTPKQISNTNPNIIQQWLDRYGLRLPRSIEDKFVYEQDVEEDLSRRGFLKGLGAAAVAGAAGSAAAQSKPKDVSAELMNMTRDDPRIQHNRDVNELAKAIYERMVAERGQPMDRRQQQQWLEIARIKAEQKFAQYAPGKPAPKQTSGFPSQGSEYRRSRNFDNFEENTVGYIQEENPDYIEEKWSEKYKRSIDCSHPRGFSQRAHCAGRKK